MWYSLFGTVLVLAITFYEGLQGLFSGLINCILAILAAALSFGVYEDLYYGVLKEYQPDHGRAIALLAVFIVTLLVLRTLFDMFIKNNLQFPLYVDRAGGGLFGFFTGMIVVGMLSIGFEMLPFGDTILGFARAELVDKSDKPVPLEEMAKQDFSQLRYRPNHSWLRQDEFTVALVSHLSDNALAGRNRLTDFYPDFLGRTYYYQARLGKEGMPTPDPKSNLSFTVDGFSDLRPTDFHTRQREDKEGKKTITLVPCKDAPAPGHKRIVVRTTFQNGGRLDFIAQQVRLIARDKKTGQVTEHLLAGINDNNPKASNKLVGTWDGELLSRDTAKDKHLDFVFEVPDGIELDEGSFIEFKQNPRTEIKAGMTQNKKRSAAPKTQGDKNSSDQPDKSDQPPAQSEGNSRSRRPGPSPRNTDDQPHDRVSGIGPARSDSTVSDELPFGGLALTNYGGGAEVSGGKYKGGHIVAKLDDEWKPTPGSNSPIERFDVPEDMRMVQVSVPKLHPGSTLGRATDFARTTLNDYKLVDQNGKEHMLVGMYAMCRINGQPTFEATFVDEAARSGDEVMARATPLETIKSSMLTGDYSFFYLYQVKVGTRAMKIRTGRQDVDLEGLNLEAK